LDASFSGVGGETPGRREGHAGRGGLPHELYLRWGLAIGLVDEVAEGALQGQGFNGEGAGGFDGAGVFGAQGVDPGGGQRQFLALPIFLFLAVWLSALGFLLSAFSVSAFCFLASRATCAGSAACYYSSRCFQ
jgi:hypothetical protein